MLELDGFRNLRKVSSLSYWWFSIHLRLIRWESSDASVGSDVGSLVLGSHVFGLLSGDLVQTGKGDEW